MVVLLTLMFSAAYVAKHYSLGHMAFPEYGTENPLFVPTNAHKLF